MKNLKSAFTIFRFFHSIVIVTLGLMTIIATGGGSGSNSDIPSDPGFDFDIARSEMSRDLSPSVRWFVGMGRF